jgi:hypothetical protein
MQPPVGGYDGFWYFGPTNSDGFIVHLSGRFFKHYPFGKKAKKAASFCEKGTKSL